MLPLLHTLVWIALAHEVKQLGPVAELTPRQRLNIAGHALPLPEVALGKHCLQLVPDLLVIVDEEQEWNEELPLASLDGLWVPVQVSSATGEAERRLCELIDPGLLVRKDLVCSAGALALAQS